MAKAILIVILNLTVYRNTFLKNSIDQNVIKVPSNSNLVYITPYEYNKRKADSTNFNNLNVFKIPSQRVLIDNTDYTLD